MIYADLASVSRQPAMMSLRPHHDPYRSLPCTPLGIDPRSLATVDLAPMLNHARMSLGLEAQDYFSSPRYGSGARASSPYSHAADVESVYEADVPGLVCRTNLAATLANAQIIPSTKYGKVHPHMCEDGKYPSDFNMPRTVESMRVLDNSQLDRIMLSYRLPLDLRAVPLSSSTSSSSLISGRISPYGSLRDRDTPISSSRARQIKLHALWEFLGCWKLIEHERLKRAGY